MPTWEEKLAEQWSNVPEEHKRFFAEVMKKGEEKNFGETSDDTVEQYMNEMELVSDIEENEFSLAEIKNETLDLADNKFFFDKVELNKCSERVLEKVYALACSEEIALGGDYRFYLWFNPETGKLLAAAMNMD